MLHALFFQQSNVLVSLIHLLCQNGYLLSQTPVFLNKQLWVGDKFAILFLGLSRPLFNLCSQCFSVSIHYSDDILQFIDPCPQNIGFLLDWLLPSDRFLRWTLPWARYQWLFWRHIGFAQGGILEIWIEMTINRWSARVGGGFSLSQAIACWVCASLPGINEVVKVFNNCTFESCINLVSNYTWA